MKRPCQSMPQLVDISVNRKMFEIAQILCKSLLFTYSFSVWLNQYRMNKTEGHEQSLSINLLETTSVSKFPLCRNLHRIINMLVLNIEIMYFFWHYQSHYSMLTVFRAVLKNYSVFTQKGTWTDGPAGPLSMYMCPIKTLHLIPLYRRSRL